MSNSIKCPFCMQEGFDLIGLKNHLVVGGIFGNTCEAFERVESIEQERERKQAERDGGDDMELPDGKYCINCRHYFGCVKMYGVRQDNTKCDFSPSRFHSNVGEKEA